MSDPTVVPLDEVLSTFRKNQTVIVVRDGQAKAAPEPTPQSLDDLLKQETGEAPASTNVAVTPPTITPEELQNLEDILLLNSYASVASMRYLYQQHPEDWDLTDPKQAAQFTRAAANAKFRVLTDGMGSFLSLETQTSRAMHKEVTSADLHFEFLDDIFQGFNFPATAMTQLDSILTSVVKQLGSLQMSWSDQSETLDHVISVFYFDEVAGVDYKLPRLRLFYLHIDQRSWELSVGKSSVRKFEFNMNFADNVFMMNPEQVQKNRADIQALIEKMTAMSLAEIDKLVAPKAVENGG
jgi:hypothetical protein